MCAAAACGRGNFEIGGLDAPPRPDSPLSDYNIAFVTSGTFSASFGDTVGADQACQNAAMMAATPLSGTYVAWLSSATSNALARLSGSRGWVRPDGVPVLDRPTSLTSFGLLAPIALSEDGIDLRASSILVFTGTDTNGGDDVGNDCTSWSSSDTGQSSVTGNGAAVGVNFTDTGSQRCNVASRLYCFGTGHDTAIAPLTPTPPYAFVSSGTWPATSGIAAADALCASDATEAGLAGTFIAALPPAGMSIASRFPTVYDYTRMDGQHLGHLFSDVDHPTAIALDAHGQPVSDFVWTGGPPNDVPSVATTCTGWTTDNGNLPYVGYSDYSDAQMFDRQTTAPCTNAARVYCLQQ